MIIVIRNLAKSFKNNKPVANRNVAFIDHVSKVQGGQAGKVYGNVQA